MRRRLAAAIGRRRGEDEIRDHRLQAITAAVESFTFSLATALAGRQPAFDECVSRDVAQQVSAALRPYTMSGAVMRPDFGAFAQVKVDGDVLDAAHPVAVEVQFDDRSVRESSDGQLTPAPRRRVHLHLDVQLEPCLIRRCTFALESDAPFSVGQG